MEQNAECVCHFETQNARLQRNFTLASAALGWLPGLLGERAHSRISRHRRG